MSEPLTAPEVDSVQGAVLRPFCASVCGTHLYLTGPFPTQSAVRVWMQRNPRPADVRWRGTIRLACVSGAAATIEVRKPEAGPMT